MAKVIKKYADELGPQKIVHLYGPISGLKAVVAIDNVAAGPAIGGVRMAPDVTTDEAFRLARAMTLKNAAAGLPHGGGKSVIQADPKKMTPQEKEKLIRAFALSIKDLTDYIPGPDMGTDETCMAWVKDEIGRCVGMPREIGGIPLDEIGATGLGCAVAAETACRLYGIPLEGARVAIQGFGAVGKHAARFLKEKGAVIVAAADSKGTMINMDGMDVERLIKVKEEGGDVTDYCDGEKGDRLAIVGVPCEIWIPAARPDVIHKGNVDQLKTKLIIAGANIPITEEAEQILDDRGVHSIPDFIANAGGVICGAVEFHGGTQQDAVKAIHNRISLNTEMVITRSLEKGISPTEAGNEIAVSRVKAAMLYRRDM